MACFVPFGSSWPGARVAGEGEKKGEERGGKGIGGEEREGGEGGGKARTGGGEREEMRQEGGRWR
jgi:hypothetical protein